MPGQYGGVLGPILRTFPLWTMGLLLVVACMVAREAGSLFYGWQKARRPATEESRKGDADGHIVGPIFGLLAFIIGLSFSIGESRFDARRSWVAEEATAINTSYLRASLLDEPYRSQLQATLREYAHTRIVPGGEWDERNEAQLAHSLALRQRLWDQTRAAIYPVRETDLAAYVGEAMNEVLSVGTRRQLAGRSHIPVRVIEVLVLYLLVAAWVLGYEMGDQPGLKRQATTALFALFAVMLMTIIDLDRPRTGAILVPQRALEELVATLDRDAPPPPAAAPTTTAP
ncbi:hypothetical protein LJR219_003493 [Phenylobacterium sp. LjRoot219]|uniref:bestrophin-like domain n=1 Tax=Phenylobacterium sp. LjRoot219 TaxID=3342283 RepID=UPI003ECCD07E